MTLFNYQHIPIEESNEPLVDLADYGFELEPAYYNDGLSDTPEMHLRKTVAERLAAVRGKLSPLNFKIWDGWRPRKVQHNIYMKYRKEMQSEHPDWTAEQLREQLGTYVGIATDPNRIPFHSTGGSVDLTLVDGSGVEFDMGNGMYERCPAPDRTQPSPGDLYRFDQLRPLRPAGCASFGGCHGWPDYRQSPRSVAGLRRFSQTAVP